jgi:hypothetical protein
LRADEFVSAVRQLIPYVYLRGNIHAEMALIDWVVDCSRRS